MDDRKNDGMDEFQNNQVLSAKIMLIDDEPINMQVLIAHLEGEGYSNFLSTDDSVNAFERIREESPDVLLLDLIMPEVTGFDILEKIRNHEQTSQLPVVVLTSSDDSETKLKVLNLGATDFLAKPVDPSELALRLRNTLAARAYQNQIINFDGLTGLPKSDLFNSTAAKLFDRINEKGLKSALFYINPVRFKVINDTFGREAGDSFLNKLSKRICKELDIKSAQSNQFHADLDVLDKQLFRIGGDQFGLLIPEIADESEVLNTAELLLSALNESYSIENKDVFINTAIGISVIPDDAKSVQEWMNHAETALLEANQSNESSYVFYKTEMEQSAKQYIQIVSALRNALPENQLFLVYQPKVDVASGVVVGAEALIRWKHPEFGIVSPDLFISLAEDTGQIVEIGRWVMEEACRQSIEWQNAGVYNFKIAVNVSIRQLMEDNFVNSVADTISQSELNPKALQLELTENMIMDNPENNVKILNDLKSLGVGLSIDDFGTGYSSLTYLQKFPIDELKIDRSFVNEIQSPLDKAPIVKAVASLGHDLGLHLVAEGVETIHQLARLKALKCQTYQGYFCSPPVDQHEFLALLKRLGQMEERKKAS